MASDPATRNIVLFAGYNGGVLSDNWTWDGTNWPKRSPSTVPPGRYYHDLVYDPALGGDVLYGGTLPLGNAANDTWEWNGSNWVQLFPAASPPASGYGIAAYDSATSSVV